LLAIGENREHRESLRIFSLGLVVLCDVHLRHKPERPMTF
jgi:hypothetical protein